MSAGYQSEGDLTVDEISMESNYIDLETETLTSVPPVYYIDTSRGAALITNGGFYVNDFEGNPRIKINNIEGLYANNDSGRTFQVDLDGNAFFAGDLEAAGGTFAGELSAATGTFSGTLSAGVALTDTTLSSQLTTINTTIGNLENQIDGAIDTWFYNGVPTLSNVPAVN